ncbi:aminotransferase [Stenotrophomonas rhizophila]|jgi:branched-subunit amino acid aminotransferase/4-amino-4-deoxychorismate lyase|uniref:aminotransferase class IV family protein n=1 Tax=Stenotrophomonas TaxID=40323 RepID=UPI000BA4FB60|nr:MULTISPECIES: aminotransferase class IV family protein [Stenotrophomonas]MDQ1063336.1 branched-subunit amino acid aminotransferase/4-amino-4-deoxychorismate lyase [Stenotrophomonas sp. SORGH_AS_0282]MDQ1188304.1 branched-subunit amino acid aminotransferase/4-amino-4-deoxychorismate lyase [Stenotrophomonas sp. SORGH_AS_0282]PAK92450.1 aminotransferase [Stenotrophomonas rhizophila]
MSVYCNGHRASADDLAGALVNYGHFTSLQVRGGAVQGLDLHLRRLRQGTEELFGSTLDGTQVQAWIAHALQAEGRVDASVRVTVFSQVFDFRQPLQVVPVDVLVAVSAPVTLPATARRVRSVVYQRELPHLKHVGTFPLFEHRRQALQAGYDDAVFVDAQGAISEGTTWNIAFGRGGDLVWPQAPALRGTQERLLQAGWGREPQLAPVRLDDLAGFDAAIACNAAGVWPIGSIDGVAFPGSEAVCGKAKAVLLQAPWDSVLG